MTLDDEATRAPHTNDLDIPKHGLLTVAEVAQVLRISKMTVYRMVHDKELASVKAGRSYRIYAYAVRDLLGMAN